MTTLPAQISYSIPRKQSWIRCLHARRRQEQGLSHRLKAWDSRTTIDSRFFLSQLGYVDTIRPAGLFCDSDPNTAEMNIVKR